MNVSMPALANHKGDRGETSAAPMLEHAVDEPVLHTDCNRVMDVMEHVTTLMTHLMQRANPLIHKAYPDTRSYGANDPPGCRQGWSGGCRCSNT